MWQTLKKLRFSGAGVLFACRALDRSWDVLLFRRAIAPDLGKWSVVGGRQDPGESLAQTALREAAEEAFSCYRRRGDGDVSVVEERLAGYIAPGFDIATCRSTSNWVPGVFRYQTFLIELASRPPIDTFSLNRGECSGCEWFPAASLPSNAHRLLPGTVSKLGLA